MKIFQMKSKAFNDPSARNYRCCHIYQQFYSMWVPKEISEESTGDHFYI